MPRCAGSELLGLSLRIVRKRFVQLTVSSRCVTGRLNPMRLTLLMRLFLSPGCAKLLAAVVARINAMQVQPGGAGARTRTSEFSVRLLRGGQRL